MYMPEHDPHPGQAQSSSFFRLYTLPSASALAASASSFSISSSESALSCASVYGHALEQYPKHRPVYNEGVKDVLSIEQQQYSKQYSHRYHHYCPNLFFYSKSIPFVVDKHGGDVRNRGNRDPAKIDTHRQMHQVLLGRSTACSAYIKPVVDEDESHQ